MQKFLNRPDDFVDDVLHGVFATHRSSLVRGTHRRTVLQKTIPPDQVPIVTGGGSGHLPLFFGYVGEGLASAAAVGGVFNSPSAEQILSCIRDVDNGRGVLLLYGNYGGDVMNFDLAAELAASEGIRTMSVRAADDVASAPRDQRPRRRGVAGITLLYRLAGASSARGDSLEEVVALLQRADEGLATVGVALSPCTLPAVGRPSFELPEGEMEIGMGLHGEPGVRRTGLSSASNIVDEVLDLVLSDLQPDPGQRVALVVNGLGATPLEELYLLSGLCRDRLSMVPLEVDHHWVGDFATSLEMSGASITVMTLDDQLRELLRTPVSAPIMERW